LGIGGKEKKRAKRFTTFHLAGLRGTIARRMLKDRIRGEWNSELGERDQERRSNRRGVGERITQDAHMGIAIHRTCAHLGSGDENIREGKIKKSPNLASHEGSWKVEKSRAREGKKKESRFLIRSGLTWSGDEEGGGYRGAIEGKLRGLISNRTWEHKVRKERRDLKGGLGGVTPLAYREKHHPY